MESLLHLLAMRHARLAGLTSLPGIAREKCEKTHPDEDGGFICVVGCPGSQQGNDVSCESWVFKLGCEIGLELGPVNGHIPVFHIVPETLHGLPGVERGFLRAERQPEIIEIPPLLALIEGTQLGAEKLLQRIDGQVRPARELGALHLEPS